MNAEFLEHLYREKFAVTDKLLSIKLRPPFITEVGALAELEMRQLFINTTIRVYIETHRHWKHEGG